jgi:uncharacterized protein YqjF (DUF2071 family)
MHQSWHDLLFLHWPVAIEHLRPLVPRALTIDTFEGEAFVALVPFAVSGLRPPLLPPLPGLSRFDEVNVRTYVHLGRRDPGVWFFSLDASSLLAVQAARALYKLPYHNARIRFRGRGSGSPGDFMEFASQRTGSGERPAACTVRYRPIGAAAPAEPGTLDHFLVERYVLYAERDGALYRARVHHLPYPLQLAEVADLRETLVGAAGLPAPQGAPLAHYAARVDVEVFPPQQIRKRKSPEAAT